MTKTVDPIAESLRDVDELLGRETAIALVKAFPGRDLHVPKTVTPALAALDDAIAGQLVETFGGEVLYVPRRVRRRDSNRKEIIELAKLSLSPVEIADRLGMSPRWVRKVLSGR